MYKNILNLIVYIFLLNIYSIIIAEEHFEQKVIVRPFKLEKQILFDTIKLIGKCITENSKEYYSQVDGTVDFITDKYSDYQQVKQNQLIIGIDSNIANSLLEKSKSEYNVAKNNYHRNEGLFKKNLISPQDMDASLNQLNNALNNLLSSQKQYNNMQIKAPVDSILSVINVKTGDDVKKGDYLFTLVSNDKQSIIISAPEILQTKLNHIDDIIVKDITNKEATGKLISISPNLSDIGGIDIKIELLQQDINFKHGSYLDVYLTVNKHHGLAVKEQCVLRNENGSFIYKIIGDKIKQVYIKTGIRTNGFIEIVNNNELSEGDLIVLDGLTKIYDGSLVQIIQ